MLEYLHSNNFIEAYHALKEESGIEYTPDPKTKYAGLLEKKWTSVIRLQKKVGLPSSLCIYFQHVIKRADSIIGAWRFMSIQSPTPK